MTHIGLSAMLILFAILGLLAMAVAGGWFLGVVAGLAIIAITFFPTAGKLSSSLKR